MDFKHSLQDMLNPICNCGAVLTTICCLLHCPNSSNERLAVRSIDENVLGKHDSIIKSPSPHSLDGVKYILTAAIEYIISIKRFDVPLSNVFIKTFFIHLSYLIFLYFLHLQMLS